MHETTRPDERGPRGCSWLDWGATVIQRTTLVRG